MKNVITKVYQYYNRFPKRDLGSTKISWQTLKKELSRVNINSMLVNLPISQSSNLLFPFVIKDKKDNYKLVEKSSNEGLIIDNTVLRYEEYEKDYDNELMLLEKADYIEDKIWDIQQLVSQKRKLIFVILIGAVITLSLLRSLDIVSSLFIVLGLVISIYTGSKENGGKLNSPICINKGIFSCDKTKAYKFFGIPFYDISTIYFLGGLLSISYFGLSLCFLIVSFLGVLFCIYCMALQIFKEKKICLLCMMIFFSFVACMCRVLTVFAIPVDYSLVLEASTILLYLISALIVVLFINGYDKEITSKAHDFDMVMSEWPVISLISGKVNKEIADSNIIIGNSNSPHILRLYIHTGCKHCPNALREMLNLISMTDDYRLHLYIRSDNRDIDTYHYNLIEEAIANGEYDKVYSIYMEWKRCKNITKSYFGGKENFDTHKDILSKAKINMYPTLIMDKTQISILPRFDNIKISLLERLKF